VERPREGDETRRSHIQLEAARTDQATYFIRINAGKSSVAIDLAHPKAHEVVLDLARVADEICFYRGCQVDSVNHPTAMYQMNTGNRFGGDPDRIYVSGHSSGAHLAGVILTTDWRRDFDLPADTVKGGLCSSGMYDLKPVRLSARNAYVKFTDEMEQALSSQRQLDMLNAPLIVSHGTLESPEFQRQARDFAAALTAAGKPVQLLVGEGYNHFEMIETLGTPDGLLGRAVLEQMTLSQGDAR